MDTELIKIFLKLERNTDRIEQTVDIQLIIYYQAYLSHGRFV